MPPATSKDTDLDKATITFAAKGDWDLNELKSFVDSFYVIYGIFFLQKLRRESFLIGAEPLSDAAFAGLYEINHWLDTPFKMEQIEDSFQPVDYHPESENAELWLRINRFDRIAVRGKQETSLSELRPESGRSTSTLQGISR